MNLPVTMRPLELEHALRQLGLPIGSDFNFAAARMLLVMLEALSMRLDEISRLQLGRLLVSTGHEITLSCRRKS
jgi:hypothetical protein